MVNLNLNPIEIQAFRKIGYGCLPSYASVDGVEWQTDFLIHLPTREINSREMKSAAINTTIGLYVLDGFPLVRLLIVINAIPEDPAKMECFFNLTREDHVKCVSSLAIQKTLRLHLFGDNLKYSHSKQISWYLQQDVTDMLVKAAPMADGKKDIDFDRAKLKFMKENVL